jgi:hypothetical protein
MATRHREELIVEEATKKEQDEALDNAAQRFLNMTGMEFLKRWDSGEYRDIGDTPFGRKVAHVSLLLPHAR